MILIIAAFIIFFVLVITLTRKVIKSGKSTKKRLNLPPGSYGWPIIGETFDFLGAALDGAPEKFITDRIDKYGCNSVFKTSILGEKVAVLCGPSGNKFLFSNENKLVTVWWAASVRKLLGPCLATTGGEEGKLMRKILSYFVTPDAFIKRYIKTMDLVSQQHIKTSWRDKEVVKVFPTMKLFTFATLFNILMSLEDQEQISKLATLFNIFLKGVISIPINFPGTRFYKARKATYAIKNLLTTIVRQRRVVLEQMKNSMIPSQDLLSHLLVSPDENGKFMSESVIVNNMLLLLFAGHDTSTILMTMLMKNLAEHPRVYERVLKEQNEIASSKEEGEFLQWEDIQKMKYSWNVACETLRLIQPAPAALREAITDINYAGYDIPKGWKIHWSPSFTHKDESVFSDNMSFDPSRFEGAVPTPPFLYVPFGGGPRMCLGKEFARVMVLIFLHNVIRRFRWELQIPDEKIEYDPLPTPVEGCPIRIHSHSTD